MGQYWKPVILRDDNSIKTSFYSHAYGNGLKLMEHSYVDNLFMRAVEAELYECPQRLVWAGDYADPEGEDKGNLYELSNAQEDKFTDELKGQSYYQFKNLDVLVSPAPPLPESAKYIVNEDRKEYVETRAGQKVAWSDDLQIHPLSLMTCEGNGRGGGDFRGDDALGFVGAWARDHIRTTNEHPGDGYSLVKFDLTEE